MLVACRLAVYPRLSAHYAGGGARAQFRPGHRSGWGFHAYDVRPHACASIFHASPCFENV